MTPQIDGCGFVKWQKATIFLSSTFNDMHAERDYFIKEIFPELNSWAKRHKIQTAYIDLRCENTEEIENNGAVATSLKHIDKSRPFFLCFIGQRIGWIPNFENDIDEETRYRYPSIKKLIDNKSITEIEIEHSLFHPLSQRINKNEIRTCPPTKHNIFFFRQNNYIKYLNKAQKSIYTNDNEKTNEKLEKIKARIIKKSVIEDEKNLKRKDDEKIYVQVNTYYGEWDKKLKIKQLSHFKNSADDGGLTNFKCENKPLKEIILNQLKEQILLAFPQNKKNNVESTTISQIS